MKKCAKKAYAFWIIFTESVGGLAAWLTRKGMKIYYMSVKQPPLSPPALVFPVVWVILYALMGIAAARVYRKSVSRTRAQTLWPYLVQLGFNLFWSIIFFNLQNFGLALLWLMILWALILWTILVFHRIDKISAWLLAPYLSWASFAAYLNYGTWVLN